MKNLLSLTSALLVGALSLEAQKISDLPVITSTATTNRVQILDLSGTPAVKTMTIGNLSLLVTPTWANISGKPTFPGGVIVGTSDTQTLTGKTLNGASNTITIRLGSDVTGTLPVANGGTGQTTALNLNDVVAISGNVDGYSITGLGDISLAGSVIAAYLVDTYGQLVLDFGAHKLADATSNYSLDFTGRKLISPDGESTVLDWSSGAVVTSGDLATHGTLFADGDLHGGAGILTYGIQAFSYRLWSYLDVDSNVVFDFSDSGTGTHRIINKLTVDNYGANPITLDGTTGGITASGVIQSATVYGTDEGEGYGISGSSGIDTGVYGQSNSGTGVFGQSNTGDAIIGSSNGGGNLLRLLNGDGNVLIVDNSGGISGNAGAPVSMTTGLTTGSDSLPGDGTFSLGIGSLTGDGMYVSVTQKITARRFATLLDGGFSIGDPEGTAYDIMELNGPFPITMNALTGEITGKLSGTTGTAIFTVDGTDYYPHVSAGVLTFTDAP